MVHLGNEIRKHLFGLLPFAVQVFHDAPFAFGEHDVHGDRSLLAEPPAAADGLVILLEAVGGEVGDVIAVLEVEPPRPDLGLGDQDTGATFGKVDQAALFHLVAVGARDLDRVRDQLLEQIALLVQVTPDQGRPAGGGDHGGDLFAALANGALLLGPLFPQVRCRHGEQHPLGHRVGVDQVVGLVQWRQDEPAVLEAKV